MSRVHLILYCTLITLAATISLPASAKCKFGEKIIDIAKGEPAKGDTVSGPCNITVRNLNVARYDNSFDATVSFGAMPDLWSKLTSISTGESASPPKTTAAEAHTLSEDATPVDALHGSLAELSRTRKLSAAAAAKDPLNIALESASQAMQDADSTLERGNSVINDVTAPGSPLRDEVTRYNGYQTLRRNAGTATNTVSAAGRSLTLYLQQSDGDIRTGGYELLFGNTSALLAPDSTFSQGARAGWPSQLSTSGLRMNVENSSAALQAAVQSFTAFKTEQDQALVAQRDALITAKADLRKAAASVSDPGALANVKRVVARLDLHVTRIEDQRSSLAGLLAELSLAVKRDSDILAGLPDIEAGGKNYSDFRAAQDALILWANRLAGLLATWNARGVSSDPFAMTFRADCHFAFSRTKTTAVQLTRIDKLPGATSNSSATPLASVECTTPFSVSAGVAFSTIGEKEFAIQAVPTGATTTENRIVQISDSSVHPLPLGIAHVRVWEASDILSLHGSFGIAGNLRGQSSGGSNAEFLLGPSVALFRTMFLTPGLYLGQKVSLANGFNTTSAVPTSITQPPLQKSYKPAFAFAITFTKP